MTKLLLFFLVLIGIGYIISYILKRALQNIFRINKSNIHKSNENGIKDNVNEIIYNKDNVVVMKGEAPTQQNFSNK